MCPLELAECRIRNRDLMCLAALCAAVGTCGRTRSAEVLLLSLLPGLLMLAVSVIGRGQLGIGDAWLFLALGLRLDPAGNYLLAQTAFLLAGIGGMLGRRKRLPLVPCVALVFSVQTALHVLESMGRL